MPDLFLFATGDCGTCHGLPGVKKDMNNKIRKQLILFLLGPAGLAAQSIDAGQMPFGGLISIYEADTAAAAIDVTALTGPGEAQAWRFTEALRQPVPDTLRVTENDPFSRTAEQIGMSRRFVHGILRNRPSSVFCSIDNDGLIEFGTGKDNGDTLFLAIPSTAIPLPLAPGAEWVRESRSEKPFRLSGGLVTAITVRDSMFADADGSLFFGDDAYYTIRLRIKALQILHYDDGHSITVRRLGWTWIAPYLGSVLELWSRPDETNPHFSRAASIWRLKSTNAEEFGCDPTCDPDYGKLPQFRLDQNEPNPFNSRTLIRYALDQASPVRLSILNILGENVWTLTQFSAPGIHTFSWDGTDTAGRPLPGGIYFCSVQALAGERKSPVRAIKRMILMR